MKKLLLVLGVIATSQFSFAQITLTNANTATIGDDFYRAEEEQPPVGLTYTNSGANQTWDFSMFLAYPETFAHSNVVNAQSVPEFGQSFPNADFAVANITSIDTTNLFFTSDANSLQAVGIGGPFVVQSIPFKVTMNFTNPQKLLQFPSTMGTSFEDTLFFDALIKDPAYAQFVDSARVKRFQTIDSEIDAWGTVTIPSGTFTCLREKRTEISTDSAWVESTAFGFTFDTLAYTQVVTELVYNWYTEDYNLPLVEIRTETGGAINSIHFRSQPSECCVGVEENELGVKFNVYPNPASEMITVLTTHNEQSFISMYDMTGREVLNQSISQAQSQFSVENLANGMYLYRIQDANGKLIKAEKIMVQK